MEPKRIRKLCKIALFEQKEERKALAVASYYKRDYIALGLLGNFILITIAYAGLCAAVVLYNADYLIDHFYQIDFYKVAAFAITGYVFLLGIYSVLVYTLRRLSYARARRKVQKYYVALNRMYEQNNELQAESRTNKRRHK